MILPPSHFEPMQPDQSISTTTTQDDLQNAISVEGTSSLSLSETGEPVAVRQTQLSVKDSGLYELIMQSTPPSPTSTTSLNIRTPSASSAARTRPSIADTDITFDRQHMMPMSAVCQLLDRERNLPLHQPSKTTSNCVKCSEEAVKTSNHMAAALAQREVDIMIEEEKLNLRGSALGRQEEAHGLQQQALDRQAHSIGDFETAKRAQSENRARMNKREKGLERREQDLKKREDGLTQRANNLDKHAARQREENGRLEKEDGDLRQREQKLNHQDRDLSDRATSLDKKARDLSSEEFDLDQKVHTIDLQTVALQKQAAAQTKKEQLFSKEKKSLDKRTAALDKSENQPFISRLRNLALKIPDSKEDQAINVMQGAIDTIQARKRRVKTAKAKAKFPDYQSPDYEERWQEEEEDDDYYNQEAYDNNCSDRNHWRN